MTNEPDELYLRRRGERKGQPVSDFLSHAWDDEYWRNEIWRLWSIGVREVYMEPVTYEISDAE